jgi:hypothetical protein
MKQIKVPIYGYVDIEDFCLPLIVLMVSMLFLK